MLYLVAERRNAARAHPEHGGRAHPHADRRQLAPAPLQCGQSVEEYTGKYNCIVDDKYNWYRVPTKFEKGKGSIKFKLNQCNEKVEIIFLQVTSKDLPAKSQALQ